ncbi:nucleotide sugar transporter SLC35D2 [Pseudophryne corroboree]|uniref:nucleotide sugar transporter SLC35D2 n=1 Tax=Pseudophryne corroboree TaxID=495146 RepID=UPI00308193E4
MSTYTEAPPPSSTVRLLAALFFAVTSFLTILANKTVLTAHRFPSSTFLGVGQMVFAILILYVGKMKGIFTFPDFNREIPRKIFPLPILYIGNNLTGLSSTKNLSLPMFTVLRKFSIIFTLILEMLILRKRYSLSVSLSVLAIVLGVFIAASFDLTFSLEGYTIVLLNDLFTALYGVYIKQKLDYKELGKYGLIFYNAIFTILPTLTFTLLNGEFQTAIHYSEWTSAAFVFQFLLSCGLGFVLLYSTVLCSYYNSALTTTVVGALKNVSIAYIGIFISGDYSFSWLNFLGLNICMAGGMAYSFAVLRESPSKTSISEEQDNTLSQSVESQTKTESERLC